MYGKQLEMGRRLAEDWTRDYALLRPKLADSLGRGVEGGARRCEAGRRSVAKWVKWLAPPTRRARQGYLKQWFGATEATIDRSPVIIRNATYKRPTVR